ncbi:phage tail protein [Bacillus pseudomycoides]|uniref:Phage tail protein n=1 Tax=Bacillus pseudomycoides TaxID=64104 RepID=A0ABD6T3U4_9BACI|nr:major tail protein [Bacillus pseudomycoides]PHE92466.1 phage tail protein [Bacillus pseudomycoides]
MPENKVSFGLKNVHYATYETKDGVVTFGTPIPLPGAVELTFEPRGDLIEFYADDMLYYAASNNQGYDGTLSIAYIPEQFGIDALGEQLDVTDGVLNELADAKGKSFALLFEFDGDIKATRHVMFNCSASRPTLASKTKTSSAEPNANELKFVSSPIDISGKRMVKTKTTSKTTPAIYDNWYKKVYVKSTAPGA